MRFPLLRRWLPILAFGVLAASAASGEELPWGMLVANGQLVEITRADPTILVEMRYATPCNAAGAILYPADLPCLVRPEVATRLKAAQAYLRPWGYGLKIWDAYRPAEAQRALWKHNAKRGYVADPDDGRGSLHTWGLAVDVTLVDLAGRDVAMPSDFDVFTAEAGGIYQGKDDAVRERLRLLHRAMFGSGFVGLTTEWWHFAARDWQKFGRLTADAPATTPAPARAPSKLGASPPAATPPRPGPATPPPAPPTG